MSKRTVKELMSPVLLLLIFLGSSSYIVTDIYLPSVPAMGKFFATGNSDVQMTIACYLFANFVGILIFGPLSDHYGKKRMILVGMSISLIGVAINIIAPFFHKHIYWIIFGRIIQGFGLAVSIAVVRSLLASLYSGVTLVKVTSIFAFIVPFLLSLAPVLGGFLEQYISWRATFVFVFFYILVLLLWTRRCLPHDDGLKRPLKVKTVIHNYLFVLKDKNFMLHSLAFSFSLAGLMSYITISPYLFQENLKLTPVEFGFVAPFVCGFLLIGTVVNWKLVDKFSLTTVSIAGALLMFLSGVLMVFASYVEKSFWVYISPILLYSFAVHLVTPNMFALAIRSFKQKGACAAVFSAIQILVMSISSSVTSLLPDDSPIYLAGIYLVCSLIAIICLGVTLFVKNSYATD